MKTKLLILLIVMMISITALFALGMTVSAETVDVFEVTDGTNNITTKYIYDTANSKRIPLYRRRALLCCDSINE